MWEKKQMNTKMQLRNGPDRAIATTVTNILESKKGANFSIVCTYFWLA